MKQIIVFLMLLVMLQSLAAADELWEKAGEIVQANWNLVPGRTRHFMQMQQRKSEEVIMDVQLVIGHSLGEDGQVANELLSSAVNGNDSEELDTGESNKWIRELLERDITPKKQGMFFSLDPANPVVKGLSETRMIDGIECRGYSFEYISQRDGNDVTFAGTMWLDIQTGAPLYSTSAMQKTPMFVRSIDIEQFYKYDPQENLWYQTEVRTVSDIRIPFKNMILKTSQIKEDYWQYRR